MGISTKNVQLDAQKITEAVKAAGVYQSDIGKLVKQGWTDFLVSAKVELGGILIKSDKTTDKADCKDCNLGDRNYISIYAKVSNAEDTYDIPFNNLFRINYKTQEEINLDFNCCEYEAFNYTDLEPIDPKVKELLKNIKDISNKLKEEAFDSDWIIAATPRKDVEITPEILTKILQVLNESYSKHKSGTDLLLNNTTVTYEVVQDVIALNLIKIIKRGTDNEKTMFTGECTGMVIEALTLSTYGMYGGMGFIQCKNKPSELLVLKSYKESYSLYEEDVNIEEFNSIMSGKQNDIIYTDTDGIKCTRYIDITALSTASLHGVNVALSALHKQTNEVLGAMRNKDETENSQKFTIPVINRSSIENYNNIELSKEQVVVLDDVHRMLYKIPTKLTLERLIIPKGKDLSASFKAKYI